MAGGDTNGLFNAALPIVPQQQNQLAPQPTWAEAADWHAQNLADTWTAMQNPQTWVDAARQYGQAMLMGTTAPGVRAFHGSPYDFSAFDASKIGTGEGAQAYGHGLYFAENEAIAKNYRDTLTQPNLPTPTSISGKPTYDLWNKYADDTGAITIDGVTWHGPRDFVRNLQQGRTTLEGAPPDLAAALQSHVNKGSMYEVNVNADPQHFLDWDKPLSEQSQHVQDALRGEHIAKVRQTDDGYVVDYNNGGQQQTSRVFPTAEAAQNAAGPLTARVRNWAEMHKDATGGEYRAIPYDAETLSAAGIPGIRYLDAGSRRWPAQYQADLAAAQSQVDDLSGALKTVQEAMQSVAPGSRAHNSLSLDALNHSSNLQTAQARLDHLKQNPVTGTSNYVVFDPATIEILRKYGIAGLIAGGGAASQGYNNSNP